MGNDADAEDVVQDAFLRALAAGDQFRGGDQRAWLLTIVRNGCYSSHRRQRVREAANFDEERHSDEGATPCLDPSSSLWCHIDPVMPARFRNWFKVRMIAGFFVTVPAVATAYILWVFWKGIDDIFSPAAPAGPSAGHDSGGDSTLLIVVVVVVSGTVLRRI